MSTAPVTAGEEGSGGRGDPLFERSVELDAIADLLESTARGCGSVLVIEGPAGIGKSALLRAAGREGIEVLRARGAQLEQDYGWGVVRQLFERWAGERPEEERARLFRGAADSAEAALGHPTQRDEQPFSVIHGLYWLTLNAAERGPLALVVDDAHWCDEASLRWLAYLGARLDDLPVSLIAGVRRPDPGADREPLVQLSASPRTRLLRPAPLSVPATERLLRERLELEEGGPFYAACHQATGGNPFLLGALADDLAPLPGGRPPDPRTVRNLRPVAISRALLLRIGALPREAQAVARALAILGGSATTPRIAAVAQIDLDATAASIRSLGAAGIVGAALPTGFVHPLIETVVREDMPGAERALWHRRAAEVLGRTGASLDEIAAQLMQCEPAADAQVVASLVDAARAALAGGAAEAAAELLARALQEPPRRDRLVEVERLRGRALLRARGAEGVDALRNALAAAESPAERTAAGLELGRALESLTRNLDAVTVYRSALSASDGADELQLRELEAGLGMAATQHSSTLPLALEAFSAMVERPSRADVADAILRSTMATGAAISGSPEGVEMAGAILAEGLIHRAEPSSVAVGLALLPLMMGDRLDAALAGWDEVIARATAGAQPLGLAFGLTFRGATHFRAGRLAEGESDLRAALELPSELWVGATVPPQTPSHLAEVVLERSGPRAAEEILKQAGLSDAGPLSDYQGNNQVLFSRGRIHAARGDARAAVADLLELGSRCAVWTFINPAGYPWRSEAAVALRDTDPARARELAEQEVALARAFGADRALGMALRAHGLVVGDRDGIEKLEEAVQVLTASPARLELARAATDLGAALRRTGRRVAAREWLAQGLDGAVACGAAPLAERARAELRLAGARLRRDRVTGRDALTTSELRVARLAAEGKTNREIAEQLWVTLKTVETHLGRVYRKLGISSRSELPGALTEAAPEASA